MTSPVTVTPLWTTAFLDVPAASYEATADFWSAVTGYPRSPSRGPEGQFCSLLPPTGTDHLRLQRLEDGPRVHLDVAVAELDAAVPEAEALGARAVAQPFDGVTVLESPGGFTFCLVRGTPGEPPGPTRWPDGRTSYVDQVCLDVPPSRYDAELDFWADLTGWERRDPRPGSEFGRVTPAASSGQPLQLLVQRLDDEQERVTAHLDWSADDHEAELAAHQAAGAVLEGRFEGWTVLRDPSGAAYCVTRRRAGARPD